MGTFRNFAKKTAKIGQNIENILKKILFKSDFDEKRKLSKIIRPPNILS